ncbi:MAG: LysR family transcriptional regulator [Armatimonadetes bacterium]|nr:LysR family transcriptional regulator [Armatimonadota bacterium]
MLSRRSRPGLSVGLVPARSPLLQFCHQNGCVGCPPNPRNRFSIRELRVFIAGYDLYSKNKMLNVHQLKIFHTVARAGSFSRAAEELRITQPSVSIQVRELERTLGVELFDQIGKRIFLTEAGKILEDYAVRVLGLLNEAEHAIRDVKGATGGHLRVGATSVPGVYLLPPVLGQLRERLANTEVTLEIGFARPIQERLLRNELDIAVLGGGQRHEALVHTAYRTDEMAVVAAPRNPLASRRDLAANDLARERLIFRERGSGMRDAIDQAFEAQGLSPLPAMELSSIEAIIHAVTADLGVSILSHFAVEEAVQRGHLAIVPVSDFHPRQTLWIVRHREKRMSSVARALLDLLAETSPPAANVSTVTPATA